MFLDGAFAGKKFVSMLHPLGTLIYSLYIVSLRIYYRRSFASFCVLAAERLENKTRDSRLEEIIDN